MHRVLQMCRLGANTCVNVHIRLLVLGFFFMSRDALSAPVDPVESNGLVDARGLLDAQKHNYCRWLDRYETFWPVVWKMLISCFYCIHSFHNSLTMVIVVSQWTTKASRIWAGVKLIDHSEVTLFRIALPPKCPHCHWQVVRKITPTVMMANIF